MMTPNSNKDNKDGNSKNNDKAMMMPTTTQRGVSIVNHAETVEVEAIVVPRTPPLCPLFATCFCWILLFPSRDVYSLWYCHGNKQKIWTKSLEQAPDLDQLAGQPVQILDNIRSPRKDSSQMPKLIYNIFYSAQFTVNSYQFKLLLL